MNIKTKKQTFQLGKKKDPLMKNHDTFVLHELPKKKWI